MKNHINKLFNFFAAIALIIVSSCETDNAAQVVSVAKVSPEVQYMGDPATLEGQGLDKVKYIFVGNLDAKFTYTDGVFTFNVPEKAIPGTNVITLVMEDNYRVTSTIDVLVKPIPTVTTITPSAAASGQNVTLIGTNLNFNTTVKVGDVNATVVSATDTRIVFTVPTIANSTRNTPVTVTTTFGSASPVSLFYPTTNLILNSELELGTGDTFTNWLRNAGATRLLSTTTPGETYFGRGLRATGTGGNQWTTQFISDRANTIVGRKYLVFMWIRSTAANGNFRFSTAITRPGSESYGNDTTIGTDWRQVTFEFTASSTLTSIALDLGARTNTYFIDNITMVAQ